MKIESCKETLGPVRAARTIHLGNHGNDFSFVVETPEGELHGMSFTREEYHHFRASLDAVAAELWGPLQ